LKNKVSVAKTIFLDEIAVHRVPKWKADLHDFYTKSKNGSLRYKYNLIGIISHIGRAEIGHYVSYIRKKGNVKTLE
jgi:ubiquitin C-terminal hydrolase